MSTIPTSPTDYGMPSRLKYSRSTPRKRVDIAEVKELAEPWVRLPYETKLSYERFQAYLKLGPDKRSLQNVAEQFGVNKSLIKRRSSTWVWRLRAHSWDCEQERLRLELRREEQLRQEREHEKVKSRQLQFALLMQKKADQGVVMLKAEKLKPMEIVSLFKIAVDLERVARGLPPVRRMRSPGIKAKKR